MQDDRHLPRGAKPSREDAYDAQEPKRTATWTTIEVTENDPTHEWHPLLRPPKSRPDRPPSKEPRSQAIRGSTRRMPTGDLPYTP